MNQRPFLRKIGYLAVIVVLLVPLSLMSMPARTAPPGGTGSRGGMLAQLRDEYKLSQANLGQIDPTSETIKLATLGMRGVAANIMWTKANDFRKREDWTGYSAALQQITKLQPNFPKVWEHLGWNVAYNLSYEFDDYRDRYAQVMKGIDFLQEGITYNENSARLMWYLGFVVSHKIGRADERVQFRRLFREDTDFHGSRPVDQRDNWLVGRQYMLEAEKIAERAGMAGLMMPLVFYSHAPMCRINCAASMEEEGVFEEKAGVAWDLGLREWTEFGSREIRAFGDRTFRLSNYEQVVRQLDESEAELEGLLPAGAREQLVEEKRETLTSAERASLDVPVEKRNDGEHRLVAMAEPKLAIEFDELAELAPEDRRDEAKSLAERLNKLKQQRNDLEQARVIVNYPYWLTRCQMERRADTLEARSLVSQADHAFQVEQDLTAARALYDQGFAKWAAVIEDFPDVKTERLFGEDMMEPIKRYETLLKRLDEEFPEDFPLQEIRTLHAKPDYLN